jgi:hypothetical protein
MARAVVATAGRNHVAEVSRVERRFVVDLEHHSAMQLDYLNVLGVPHDCGRAELYEGGELDPNRPA